MEEKEANINSEQKPVKRSGKDLKIIIVGDSGTGKTSFVNKYILNKFAETYSPTIGSQFSYKIIKIDDVMYRLQFWDIAGQDRNPEATGIFCKDSKGIILCCEVKKNITKENTIKWKESISKNIDIKDIPIILIENKCDLLGNNEDDYNKNIDLLNNFCEENNINKCFRTSAINGFGVEDSINFLIRKIIGNGEINKNERNDSIILQKEIHQEPIRGTKSKKCC
jgi:small GTP-binding protein